MSEQHTTLVSTLPSIFSDRHDSYPPDLIGATIVRFGTMPESKVEGGGLVIEYRPAESETTKRLTLAFNELGMWVVGYELAERVEKLEQAALDRENEAEQREDEF